MSRHTSQRQPDCTPASVAEIIQDTLFEGRPNLLGIYLVSWTSRRLVIRTRYEFYK
jgi:hypothetical protein